MWLVDTLLDRTGLSFSVPQPVHRPVKSLRCTSTLALCQADDSGPSDKIKAWIIIEFTGSRILQNLVNV